jgi:Na+/H+ antiporter NhaD/arsenite permease-like protein
LAESGSEAAVAAPPARFFPRQLYLCTIVAGVSGWHFLCMAHPNLLMIFPFGVLLMLMAVAPLLAAEWWGRHYGKVCLSLGLLVIAYYFWGLGAGERIIETFEDYIRFIVLIGSLFVVSGGIHINVKGEATPLVNVIFLLAGTLVSNLVGTTGASMLLIRPWLRMNRYRITGYHVVFFIFLVSNVGGSLTPIGDPPLYLGYLKGVPFWWVARNCWPVWCVGVGVLLAAFYFLDSHNYLRAPANVRQRLAEPPDEWRFSGTSNLLFLGIILAATFIERPFLLRETIMAGAAFGSYWCTPRTVHESNHFSLLPIKEVAILFGAIFSTMMPALDWLQGNAARLGDPSPGFYFAASGALSSVLDNAPTYLTFLSAILGTCLDPALLQHVQQLIHQHGADLGSLSGQYTEAVRRTLAVFTEYHPASLARGSARLDEVGVCFLLGDPAYHKLVVALSAGAVFFGANTYIGNGPNLMVKAIADQHRVHMPSFFGYVARFTIPYMFPMLMLVWWLFFRI